MEDLRKFTRKLTKREKIICTVAMMLGLGESEEAIRIAVANDLSPLEFASICCCNTECKKHLREKQNEEGV